MESQLPKFRQEDQDQLKILSICFKVYGVIHGLLSSFALIHVCLGAGMVFNPDFFKDTTTGEPAPAFLGWIFLIIGLVVLISGWTIGILNFIAGKAIMQRTKRTLILVMAGINCLSIPLGTTLGIFTF